jgi:4a-hydroxytetrahydrobiopterin dehydratase
MTMDELADKSCAPCKGAIPMTKLEVEPILQNLPGWSLTDGAIEKVFRFESYLDGLEFAYTLGKVAEKQDHHPDILVKWRRVKVTLSTHVIKGLSMNDFIMAAKAERENRKYRSA